MMYIIFEARDLENKNVWFVWRYLNIAKICAIIYFAKFIKAFLKLQNLNISRNELYIRILQITRFKIIYMFMLYKVAIFRTPENGVNFDNFAKIDRKIVKSKFLSKLKMNRILR